MKYYLATALLLAALAAVKSNLSAQEEMSDDPLGDIALDMQLVVGDLTRLYTGKPTQETQEEIVSKLDELIARLEEEAQSSRGGRASANPNRPAADSVIKAGPGGMGDLRSARRQGREWGQLPPKERERILQSRAEGFPAHYERLLERYYRRVAEESSAADVVAEAAEEADAELDDSDLSNDSELDAAADSNGADEAAEEGEAEPTGGG
jgi:hypothetical protein